MRQLAVGLGIAGALLGGCGSEPAAPAPTPAAKPATPAAAPREATRPIEAASAVGYDGADLRKQVDGMLDQQQQRDQQLQRQIDEIGK